MTIDEALHYTPVPMNAQARFALLLFVACATAAPRTDDLRVRVEWLRPQGMVTAELYGSGAGVWNDEKAFRTGREDVAEVVRAVGRAGFANMPNRIGEAESDFLRIRGKVTVNGKTVVQILDGEQSEELATLAATILTRTETPGQNGVTAVSLKDGLQKIAGGAIPPEALRLTLQQRDDLGVLLHIRGGAAVARSFSRAGGYSPQRRLLLSADELRRISTLLLDLPQIAPAQVYTELRVEVLNQSKDLQARPAMAMGPNSDFDRIVEELRRIAERALAMGSPAPDIE